MKWNQCPGVPPREHSLQPMWLGASQHNPTTLGTQSQDAPNRKCKGITIHHGLTSPCVRYRSTTVLNTSPGAMPCDNPYTSLIGICGPHRLRGVSVKHLKRWKNGRNCSQFEAIPKAEEALQPLFQSSLLLQLCRPSRGGTCERVLCDQALAKVNK